MSTNGHTNGHIAFSGFEHEQLVMRRGRRSGATVAVAIHSTALGPALGGVRMWWYPEIGDGIADVLRLARGDDPEGGGSRPRPRRRQGRDLRSRPDDVAELVASPRHAARLRRPGGVARRRLHHRRGRRHRDRGHARDRRADRRTLPACRPTTAAPATRARSPRSGSRPPSAPASSKSAATRSSAASG